MEKEAFLPPPPPKENIPMHILIIVYSASDKSLWRKSKNNKILFKKVKTWVIEKSIYCFS